MKMRFKVNHSEIKKHCESITVLSRAVIDEFLIHYAAEKERLVPQMEAQLRRYKKAVRDIPVSYVNFLKSEYIAHRIFRKGGYIVKYLNRLEVRNLPQEQYQYLEFQARNPWRFSFAEIRHKPEDAFFEMEDVMTGEEYLLYSPGMQATEAEHHPRLWFNLIAYNGKCWQTFGLIIPFKSFKTDDLFFFATELNSQVEDEEMLMKEVENNPIPFFVLLSASNVPVIAARGQGTVFCLATDVLEGLSTQKLSGDFTSAWNKGVYQLRLKKLEEFPDFAIAYYHEQKRELIRTAMTESGFAELTWSMVKAGYDLSPDADIAVTPGMLSAAEIVLDKKIVLNPYEKLFSKQKDEAESDELKRINRFLGLALPFYNAGKEPDIKRLAEEAGIKQETAAEVWKKVKSNMDEAKGKM